MSYEWDPTKARANFEKHGIHFADAAATLEDELALTMRDPFSEEEERWITLGKDAGGRLLVVVYTLARRKCAPDFSASCHVPRGEPIRGTP